MLSFSDISSAAADWQPAMDKVVDGTAAYNVMGDWAAGYLGVTKSLAFPTRLECHAVARDGGGLQLPVRLVHVAQGRSAPRGRGEVARSCAPQSRARTRSTRRRGRSRPGSTPTSPSTRTTWPSALTDWTNPSTKIVGSLAHGVVANNAWNGEIDTALGLFVQDKNVAKFADAVAKAYGSTR